MPLNGLIIAAIDVLVLAGAAVFMWRSARRGWRFIRLSQRTSFGTALRRHRFVAQRQAFRCATDLHYYASRLAIFVSGNVAGLAGLVAVGIVSRTGRHDPPLHGGPGIRFWMFALPLVVLVIFIAAMTLRTAKLARRVMIIRRRLRRLPLRAVS
jgi:hypothetical protein